MSKNIQYCEPDLINEPILEFVPGEYRVGDIIAVKVTTEWGPVTHVGILSDRCGPDGYSMVIHRSKDLGDAQETSMREFARKGISPIWSRGYPGNLGWQEVLRRARSMIGTRWHIEQNCEHFVTAAHGLTPSSPQLQKAVSTTVGVAAGGVVLGLLLGALLEKGRRA